MRSVTARIIGLIGLLVSPGFLMFALSGCFLLGPQVEIPTLAPNASPVVGGISSATVTPTTTMKKEGPIGKATFTKTTGTLEAKNESSSTPSATKELPTVTASATLEPSTPTFTPEPPCTLQVDSRLLAAYNAVGGRTRLGCAKAGAVDEQWGFQQYEHGSMFWRGPKTTIYAGQADNSYSIYTDDWNSSLPERTCDHPAPSGLMQPKRGFGLVWCKYDDLRAALGFAIAEEYPAQSVVQEFVKGIVAVQAGGDAFVFFNDNTWMDLGIVP
jgi:hypothetical protein